MSQNILSDDDVNELYRLYTAYDEEEDKSIVVTIEQCLVLNNVYFSELCVIISGNNCIFAA